MNIVYYTYNIIWWRRGRFRNYSLGKGELLTINYANSLIKKHNIYDMPNKVEG